MSNHWINDAVFYHIYPLGLCNAPTQNNFASEPTPRLDYIYQWLDHIQSLGCNSVLLGPVFESSAHGYDTADFIRVDRRLGTHDSLIALTRAMKDRNLRVVLDAVFNHVGRHFFAFQDIQRQGRQSAYVDWFKNLNFDQTSVKGDPFNYEGWAGHYDLVKLNLSNQEVQAHLFQAVKFWVDHYGIEGLRLDAADQIDPYFFQLLREYCQTLNPDFWLMGEVVHGDYNHWANPQLLHATTNYESYKGLYSSHVDSNYFEIAYSLNRQFGENGIYKALTLYNFADNHDVNRVASNLSNPAHLYPLYGLLFTMPGVPSLYYGSEWGIEGKRTETSDRPLRPSIDIHSIYAAAPHLHLPDALRRFADVRQRLSALRFGTYQQLYVNHQQLAFQRQTNEQTVIVTINAAAEPVCISLDGLSGGRLYDVLNNEDFPIYQNQASIELDPNWLRIMVVA
ncbi:MAG: alpha-amylase family glycosyl hydrolase [Chloroflexota bacterium]